MKQEGITGVVIYFDYDQHHEAAIQQIKHHEAAIQQMKHHQ